ncbi:MAG: hypothetical protein CSA55_03615 [Ilumatobacter coccineus]|uniref:ABC transmembrane type-1 domain-containing protein n=1 Tax=Ilumatobacter coccineus TaxID=467094 RepID=A0A2G6K9D0_9ACTN|nr:MAG: hypothetical protein CSA55_03615 [Ilumatobacter coccineus]
MTMISAADPNLIDDRVLDQFTIPFGDWIKQIITWVVAHLEGLLDVIKWPFDVLLHTIVDSFLTEVSWVVVVAIMFVIAYLARNLRVAIGVAIALIVCGLLGYEYWIQTARTIGYIAVAVIICVIVGIPIGILSGRYDGVWRVVRPVLDAMQVVHSFVYMLPFIYFWGIGEVSATMVTMIFAIPPLIRLTNLGIRQVPAEVVEASRSFGASERRVLVDVQIPLARPAIMTGINQTLLLSISMLGIAAIMGAGGLGNLLFKAINNQDPALAASAGLAFFLVAVVLDRISQPEGGNNAGLFRRIGRAWRARRDPSALLADRGGEAVVDTGRWNGTVVPLTSAERSAALISAAGAVIAVISLVLPWAHDAAKYSSYARRADEALAGQVLNGLAASGGSWFGVVIAGSAVVVVAAAVVGMVRPGWGPRWLRPDGATAVSIVVALVALAYGFGQASPRAVDHRPGVGVIVAIIGGLIMVAGSLWWMVITPTSPRRPLPLSISKGRLLGGGVAVILAVIALVSAWSFDQRQDVVFSPELEAEIQEIKDQVEAGEVAEAVGAQQITTLRNQATVAERIILDGATSQGARLGWWTLLASGAGLVALIPGAGLSRASDRHRWIASTVSIGCGAGAAGVGLAWIGTLARATDPKIVSGVGSFIAVLAGGLLVAVSTKLVTNFERDRVYRDQG